VPVARFWADLSAIADPDKRATQLHDFFYKGLPGFKPVVRADAYGAATPKAPGQVRTNQFMRLNAQQNWLLRQFTLQLDGGFLRFKPAAAHSNPEGLLFNETVNDPKGADFRKAFLDVVGTLMVNDLNRFNMESLSAAFNAFDSDAQSPTKTNYASQFAQSPNFSAAIQARLDALGNPDKLTPADIVARAQALSCAGCHEISSNKAMGGGLTYPASLRFVHVAENQTEVAPDGPGGSLRYMISPALTNLFLPRRQQVMRLFLGGS
jgi:hypothetical protein